MKNDYRCKHCMKIVKRDSDKAWIKSYCDESGRTVHLVRIKRAVGKSDIPPDP